MRDWAGKTVECGWEESEIEASMVHKGDGCEGREERVFQQVRMIICGRCKDSSLPPRFLAGVI